MEFLRRLRRLQEVRNTAQNGNVTHPSLLVRSGANQSRVTPGSRGRHGSRMCNAKWRVDFIGTVYRPRYGVLKE